MTDKIKRDRFKRPIVDGEPYTRPSTLGKTLDDQGGLMKWGQRTVAFGLADRPDLLAMMQTIDRTDRKAVNDLCERAGEAGGATLRRELGTAIHKVMECSWSDPDYQPPAQFAGHVRAVNEQLRKCGLSVVPDSFERFVVNKQFKTAGSFDLCVTDGTTRFIADLKTGASMDYGALGFAIQLCCYALSETFYDGEQHTPMWDVSQTEGVIIHIQPDDETCTIYKLDLTVGLGALQLALGVRSMRKQKPLTKLEPVVVNRASELAVKAERVAAAGDPWRTWMVDRIKQLMADGYGQLVADMWPVEIPKLSTQLEYTADQKSTIEHVVGRVERQAEAAFPIQPDLLEPQNADVESEPEPYKRRPTPDEVGEVSEQTVTELNLVAKQLTDAEYIWLSQIIKECGDANYPIKLGGFGGVPSARRHAICTALIKLAPHMDDQVAVAAAWLVRNEPVRTEIRPGDVIGSLSFVEAHNMISVADELNANGYHLLYTETGCEFIRSQPSTETGETHE
jgi:hypothetical protein